MSQPFCTFNHFKQSRNIRGLPQRAGADRPQPFFAFKLKCDPSTLCFTRFAHNHFPALSVPPQPAVHPQPPYSIRNSISLYAPHAQHFPPTSCSSCHTPSLTQPNWHCRKYDVIPPRCRHRACQCSQISRCWQACNSAASNLGNLLRTVRLYT